MSASTLWASVVANYDEGGLVSLTNTGETSSESIDTAVGESAAREVIDLWPIYAQEEFSASNTAHMAVGRHAVIAVLWHRGGTSTDIAKVRWDDVFSPDGLISRVRRTGPRGRQGPSTNSGVQQRTETVNGRRVRGWSDPDSLPGSRNYLPTRRIADDY